MRTKKYYIQIFKYFFKLLIWLKYTEKKFITLNLYLLNN